MIAVENKPEKQPGPRRQARRLTVAARKGYDVSMAVVGVLARGAAPLSRKLRELSGAFRPSSPPFFLWVHACSVGEMMVARRFMDCWRDKTGHDRIFLTAWTRDGHRIAESRIQPGETATWFPLDSRAAMRRTYDAVQPKAVVLCEAELWPNHLAEAQARGIPVFVINGRMSEADEAKYHRLGSLASDFFAVPDTVFAQSEQDALRFASLGARRTFVTGNMKFDELKESQNKAQQLEAFSGLPYIFAASTHRGEEASVLRAFMQGRVKHPALKLVIAPRHVKRSAAIAYLARQHGLRTQLFSRNQSARDADCIVVDRVGLLPSLYAHARLAFVGKSLHARGGQNFLEAVEAGCPVVVGPHMENFEHMLAPFKSGNSVCQIDRPEELAGVFETLLDDDLRREEMAKKARLIMREQSGATELTVREILSRL